MPKTTFTATDPNGFEHKRTSDRRSYTHTVVYRRSEKDYVEQAIANHRLNVSTGEWLLACVANGKHASLMGFKHYAEDEARHAADVVDSVEKLGGAKNAVEYADKLVTEHVAELKKRDWNTYWNAGWCGRRDLAEKLAAKFGPTALILEAKTK